MADPILRILESLGTTELSPERLASAWATSDAPHCMVRLLAAAGSAECDVAARAAVEAAAEVLGSECGPSEAIEELALGAQRPTVCGELSNLLNNTWLSALGDCESRDALEAAIAERVRDAVKRPPTIEDLAAPPRRARVATGAGHLAGAIADASALDPDIARGGLANASAAPRGVRVISPQSYGRLGPELGGLACERIFGPWWPRGEETEDDRVDRWGHIELGHPCAHPIVSGAKLTVLPVVPPHFRRSTILSVDDLRRHAREKRAELEAADRRGTLCDPPAKVLAQLGLADPDSIAEPGLREHPLNTVYRAFINLDYRRRRLVELGAPPEPIAQTDAELDQWSRLLAGAWPAWLTELPADTDRAWALRALACT
jgi:hypothetical protein